MLNCNRGPLIAAPDVHIQINCDTILAINLDALHIGEQDEFVFTLKNYDYIDSPYVFIFKAKKSDADYKGEVIFKIPQTASRLLKTGAFYTLAVLTNAFDPKKETIYKTLVTKGNISLEYGAQDMMLKTDLGDLDDYEIVSMRFEPLLDGENFDLEASMLTSKITGMRLELVSEE